jgi:hypothetical protein
LDTKPFNQPLPDYWTSLEPVTAIILVLAVLAVLGAIFCLIVDTSSFVSMTLIMVAFCFSLMGLVSGAGDQHKKHVENYDNAIAELNNHLADEGFQIISGTPDLHPNTQSSMLLSYKEKSFDCTMFSPKDANTSVVFSCGEAKLTLTEVKNNVSK